MGQVLRKREVGWSVVRSNGKELVLYVCEHKIGIKAHYKDEVYWFDDKEELEDWIREKL